MRLAEPDTHQPAFRLAESMLPADQVAVHNEREGERVGRRAAHA